MNFSIQTPEHLDEHNDGWSLIYGLGDYTGG